MENTVNNLWKKKVENIYLLFVAGAVGALVKEIIEDNCIKLPTLKGEILDLGFLGGIVIGAFAGYAIDGSYLTAAMGGFSGTAVIQALISKKSTIQNNQDMSIEETIREIAKKNGIDADLAIKVAKCESGLNPKAVNINEGNGTDRGLFQINSKYHPEVSDEQAFNPEFATQFFCTAFKNGNLSWWNASRTCWEK